MRRILGSRRSSRDTFSGWPRELYIIIAAISTDVIGRSRNDWSRTGRGPVSGRGLSSREGALHYLLSSSQAAFLYGTVYKPLPLGPGVVSFYKIASEPIGSDRPIARARPRRELDIYQAAPDSNGRLRLVKAVRLFHKTFLCTTPLEMYI